MSRGVKIGIGIVSGLLLVCLVGFLACEVLFAPDRASGPQAGAEATATPGETGLPNPASVYCEEQGGRVEIRTAADGGQYGMCIFADGSECLDWAFYRGECGPGQ